MLIIVNCLYDKCAKYFRPFYNMLTGAYHNVGTYHRVGRQFSIFYAHLFHYSMIIVYTVFDMRTEDQFHYACECSLVCITAIITIWI